MELPYGGYLTAIWRKQQAREEKGVLFPSLRQFTEESGDRVIANKTYRLSIVPFFNDSIMQFFNELLCLLQVFGIKAFGEPGVEFR